MKAVILLAGVGRRMGGETNHLHKALIPLQGKPLLEYLLENLRRSKITEVIPVLGYQRETVLSCIERCSSDLDVRPVYNPDYANSNNLVSLVSAEKEIGGEDFILINGDMVFDPDILIRMKEICHSCIAVDMVHKAEKIDSPKVQGKQRITDLGREIPLPESIGYAIGIYRFQADLLPDFMSKAKEYITRDRMHGFHDPLRDLFADHEILPVNIGTLEWKDIDDPSDLKEAEEIIRRLYGSE